MADEIPKIADNLNIIGLNKHGQHVVKLLKCVLHIDDEHRSVEEFVGIMHDELLPSVEEIMTLAERIEEKGRREGEIQGKLDGKIEIVQEMLKAGADIAFIAKAARLPLDKIKALKKN